MSLTFPPAYSHTRESSDMWGSADFCLVIIICAPHALLCCHIYQAPEHQHHSPSCPNMWSGFPLCGPGTLTWTQSSFGSVCSQIFRNSSWPIFISSSLPGEPTQQPVTVGLAKAQCGHILNSCILALNSLFCTQIGDSGAVQLHVISSLQPDFTIGSISTECWSQTQGRRDLLLPICVLWASGWSPHAPFFYLRSSRLFLQQQLNLIFLTFKESAS